MIRLTHRSPLVRLFVIAFAIAAFLAVYLGHAVASPSVPLLPSGGGGGQWLRPNVEPFFGVQVIPVKRALYQAPVVVRPSANGWNVDVLAYRLCTAWLGGTPLRPERPVDADWKQPVRFHIPSGVVGSHVFTVAVDNTGGPAMVCVSCPGLGLESNSTWGYSDDGQTWAPALTEETPERLGLPPDRSPSAGATAPWLILPLCVAALCLIVPRPKAALPWAPRLRWLLIAAWLGLAGINLVNVPSLFGFDCAEHLAYIRYVASRHRLPTGLDGWQMFQAPLYYLVSAPLWAAVRPLVTLDTAARAMRLIPIACGVAMIELTYRTLRTVFPSRGDLQCIGLVVCGLLPVNLYMMQFPSNEPLMAVLAAAAVWQLCRFALGPETPSPARASLVIGALMGLAILAKVSALIWLIPVPLLLLTTARRRGLAWGPCAGMVGRCAGVALLIPAGWFAYNLHTIGVPLLTHSGQAWWQDPGYRTIGDLFRFGDALRNPVVLGPRSLLDSVFGTFWADGLDSGLIGPPAPIWNLHLMLMGEWFAVVPTLLMLYAAAHAWVSAGQDGVGRLVRFSSVSIALFLLAITQVYLTLPIFSCGKASYMLSATPCFAILTAAGYDRVPRRFRRALGAVLATGAVMSFAAFVAVGS